MNFWRNPGNPGKGVSLYNTCIRAVRTVRFVSDTKISEINLTVCTGLKRPLKNGGETWKCILES